MSISSCRSCGAPVEWVKSNSGKLMPLDVGDVENGNLTVANGVARGRRDEDDIAARPRRRSHFSTCPHALAWRTR
jgi:hypothetical protein